MSGGFGSLDSMNKTLKNNRDLLRKKGAFEILKENTSWNAKRTHYKYRRATARQLISIRKKMRGVRRVNFLKGAIALVLSLLVVYFIFNMFLEAW